MEELNDLEGLDNLANLGFEEEPSEGNLFEELSAISIGQYLSTKPTKSPASGDQLINVNLLSVGSVSTLDQGLKLGVKDVISGGNQGLHKDQKKAVLEQIMKRDASKLESNFEFDDRKEASIPWILINLGMQLHSKRAPIEKSKIEAEMVRSLEKILCELPEQEKSKLVVEALESLQWRVSRELSQIDDKDGLA